MTDLVAIIFVFGGLTLVLLAISPIGRAVGDRIRGGGPGGRTPAVEDAIAELRREVAELAERVDFVERLSAGPREGPRIAPR
jgi:hypothetical protein